ncbi:MAG: hypothetical protein ACYC3Q_12965 [Gemmatimonadaceae bacterium]
MRGSSLPREEEMPPALVIWRGALRFASLTALAILVAEAVAGERSAVPVRALLVLVLVVALARAGVGFLVGRRRRGKGNGN